MDTKTILLQNLEKIHTTPMGINRIKKNLCIDVEDVISWTKEKISNKNSKITRKGKNWYAVIDGLVFTVNSYTYTIITAHKEKKS